MKVDMSQLSRCLALLLAATVALASRGRGGEASPRAARCPIQELVHARPDELGVTHVRILGAMNNTDTSKVDPVIFHAFVRIVETMPGSKHMYGIGWVEGTATGKKTIMPAHAQYLAHMPSLTLQAVSLHGTPMGHPIDVIVTHGSNLDTRRMGFRLEALFRSAEAHFLLGLKGWNRTFAVSTGAEVKPGTILPWRNMEPRATTTAPTTVPSQGLTGSMATATRQQAARQFAAAGQRRWLLAQLAGQQQQQDGARAQQHRPWRWPMANPVALVFGKRLTATLAYLVGHLPISWPQDVPVTAHEQLREPLSRPAQGQLASGATLGTQHAHRRALQEGVTAASTATAQKVAGARAAGNGRSAGPARHPSKALSNRSPAPQAGARHWHAEGPLVAVDDGRSNTNPPLVVIITLAFGPSNEPSSLVHYAQQFVRHVEYHLDELGMQRVLVYIHKSLYLTPMFLDFVARHLHPHLVPYVTFVVWNEFVVTANLWYDQYVRYFHGMVGLWGYGGVMAALIDIDEYIAFPGPRMTLHKAFERCNATHLDSARLVNHFVVCEHCLDSYRKLQRMHGVGSTDLELWAARAQHDLDQPVPVTPTTDGRARAHECQWWREDPLLNYTRRWSSRWFKVKFLEKFNATLGEDEAQYPTLAFTTFQSKQLLRPEATVALMHHRAELLPKHSMTWLDPRTCPYIVHLAHANGFRPWRLGAKLEFFDGPPKRPDWFLLTEADPHGAAAVQQLL